jgi:all-trans-retinol 13,14-reductase
MVAKNVIKNLKSTEELSVSYIFLFVALDITNQPITERDHTSHNRWVDPCRDFTQMEKNIENNSSWSQPMPMFVASGSAKDQHWSSKPGLSENKKTIVVLSVCPWKWVEKFAHISDKERKKNIEYQNFKQLSKEKMMEQGFRQVFPKLEQYITYTEVGTPLSTKHYLGKGRGECYGRAAMPKHWSDPALVPHTPLKNYYLTGQDIG